jgi:hypothetical protein
MTTRIRPIYKANHRVNLFNTKSFTNRTRRPVCFASSYTEINRVLYKNCRIITLGCPVPDSERLVTGSSAQFFLAFTPDHWQIPGGWRSKRIRPEPT